MAMTAIHAKTSVTMNVKVNNVDGNETSKWIMSMIIKLAGG